MWTITTFQIDVVFVFFCSTNVVGSKLLVMDDDFDDDLDDDAAKEKPRVVRTKGEFTVEVRGVKCFTARYRLDMFRYYMSLHVYCIRVTANLHMF